MRRTASLTAYRAFFFGGGGSDRAIELFKIMPFRAAEFVQRHSAFADEGRTRDESSKLGLAASLSRRFMREGVRQSDYCIHDSDCRLRIQDLADSAVVLKVKRW